MSLSRARHGWAAKAVEGAGLALWLLVVLRVDHAPATARPAVEAA